jgi:hypothetical protein
VAKEQRDEGKGDGDVWRRTMCDKGNSWFLLILHSSPYL